MLSENEISKIRQTAYRALGSHFQHLGKPNESGDLTSVIAKAIAEALREYDLIRRQ